MTDATHASFFSGVGGLDLGLERAGWRTVSFSEIDPYASAVLAERWPGVPNLGDIVRLAAGSFGVRGPRGAGPEPVGYEDASRAALWTGGFPCQDLSVAGKRRGLAGSRSGLAFSFLELVGRHRPRFVLLENVPGLLSSHAGRDFGTLLAALVELGYGVGYRVLDARYFGVPQRRRRVFILGDSTGGRAGAERAAEVLSVGSRCRRHPPTGVEAGAGTAERTTVGALPAGVHGFPDGVQEFMQGHFRVQPQLGSSPDARGVRAPDGLAGGSHDRGGLAGPLLAGSRRAGQRPTDLNTPLTFTKSHRAASVDDGETWVEGEVAPTLNDFDTGDTRAVSLALGGRGVTDDPLLPLGLDSHRYRCCGNGVVSDVAEWIGRQLIASLGRVA